MHGNSTPQWMQNLFAGWPMIRANLPTFFVIVVLILVAIWWLMDWRYGGIVANRDSEISSLKTQRDEYKDKLSGATPDQAKARIDVLEARLAALEPRRLTTSQRAALVAGLASPPIGSTIDVMSEPAGDNTQFASDFISVFRLAGGWIVGESTTMSPSNRPPSGLAIRFADLHNPPQIAVIIMNVFRAQNIRFDAQQDTRLRAAMVLLLICAKPD